MSRMLRRLAGTTAAVALVAVPILPSQAVTQTTAAAVQSTATLPVTDALGRQDGSTQTVRGYVVGQPTATDRVVTSGFPNDYAIAIAATPGETDTGKILYVQVPSALRSQWGLASNPDLKASIPGLTVNGNGDVDLRVLGMDYRVGIVIEGDKGAMPDPACQVNERYVGIEWPLRCRGPLELGAKACRFDNDALGKIAARLAGERLNEKIEEKLGDKVSPELKDALKGLFKR